MPRAKKRGEKVKDDAYYAAKDRAYRKAHGGKKNLLSLANARQDKNVATGISMGSRGGHADIISRIEAKYGGGGAVEGYTDVKTKGSIYGTDKIRNRTTVDDAVEQLLKKKKDRRRQRETVVEAKSPEPLARTMGVPQKWQLDMSQFSPKILKPDDNSEMPACRGPSGKFKKCRKSRTKSSGVIGSKYDRTYYARSGKIHKIEVGPRGGRFYRNGSKITRVPKGHWRIEKRDRTF